VTFGNSAYRGTTCIWAMDSGNVQHRVIETAPDFVILASGMNDGTQWRGAAEFPRDLSSVVSTVKAPLPNVELTSNTRVVSSSAGVRRWWLDYVFLRGRRCYGPSRCR
jgi:hypothetical protein